MSTRTVGRLLSASCGFESDTVHYSLQKVSCAQKIKAGEPRRKLGPRNLVPHFLDPELIGDSEAGRLNCDYEEACAERARTKKS